MTENKLLLYSFTVAGVICVLLGLYLVFQDDTQVIKLVVPATSEWTPTGIDTAGKVITITRISGVWNSTTDKNDQDGRGLGRYPGTVFPDANIGELIGKIDDKKIRVGTGVSFSDTKGGFLFLGMNDVPGKYGDNHGELIVEITVK